MFPLSKVNWVDCHALSTYFLKEYGKEVNVLVLLTDLWNNTNSNGSYIMLDVSYEGPESCWEVENWTSEIGLDLIDQWLKGERETDVELLLWHQLYLRNITGGEYYIDIHWQPVQDGVTGLRRAAGIPDFELIFGTKVSIINL